MKRRSLAGLCPDLLDGASGIDRWFLRFPSIRSLHTDPAGKRCYPLEDSQREANNTKDAP